MFAGDGVEAWGAYRTAITDATGNPIPDEGELRVWLDDLIDDRPAPEGWLHFVTAREVCFVLLTGRVVALSLDHDLGEARVDDPDAEEPNRVKADPHKDVRFGKGSQVIDFLEEQHGVHGRSLWPRDGISLHTANPEGRETMRRAILALPRKIAVTVDEDDSRAWPHFVIRPRAVIRP